MLPKKPQSMVFPALLICLGWGLLAWNVVVVITGTINFAAADLAEQAVRTISVNLLHSVMLAFAAVALSLVAYLHFKQGYRRTTAVAVAIIAALVLALVYPTYRPVSAAEGTAASKGPAQLTDAELIVEGLVSGIVFSEDRPAAVVGTQVLYEGDVKDGVTVVKITKDQVQFEKNGRVWTQTVQQPPPKHWK